MTDIPTDPNPHEARAPKTRVPSGATDTHFHLFGSKETYHLSPDRMYEPSDASVERYLRMADTLGIQRMVVVNGSPYGSDNRCILDGIQAFGLDRARGVAVVDQDVSPARLKELYGQGIRGIRFNLITGTTTMDDLKAVVHRLADAGMHAQFWLKSQVLENILDIIDSIDVPVVLDHMGQVPTSFGLEHPHFQSLLRLLGTGKVWVKLIGYRISAGPPYADVAAQVHEIVRRIPDQCLWGTDWPHPLLKGMPMPNDGDLMDLLASWVDVDQLKRVLVDNPARLYGF